MDRNLHDKLTFIDHIMIIILINMFTAKQQT